ncbi:MAG: molybdate ABC transporter substrate-binding protein, partial [Rhodospirillales bacterium]
MLRNFLSTLVFTGFLPAAALAGEPLTIFAAASTQQAVEAVIAECPKKIKVSCRGVYAASSTLARQIAGGAPADIYLSANMKWMRYLDENKHVVSSSIQVLAANRLVVIAPSKSTVSIKTADDLISWLTNDRIAVGDPAHVPAGIYAEQTLRSLNRWTALEGKLLRMPNVRAALSVVARGEAAAGIVYATDSLIAANVRTVYRFENTLHDPIRYPVAIVTGHDTERTRSLMALFNSTTGREAFKAAG